MNKNKFGKYIILGALSGAVVSLFDRATREQVLTTSRKVVSDVSFYSKNTNLLKSKVQEKAEKYQAIYEQFSDDASYFKKQVNELKALSPQVKDLMVETKDAFVETKEEYKTILKENSSSENIEK